MKFSCNWKFLLDTCGVSECTSRLAERLQNPARESDDLFKIQQERKRVTQNPARERRTYSKSSKRESELFKIQQEREKDVLKIQQERATEREEVGVCIHSADDDTCSYI